MRAATLPALTLLLTLALGAEAEPAQACGGFFCGRQPVDQMAERILFAVHDNDTTTMVVQIAYRGDAADFAWVLPLADVPDADSLDTFPQGALTALDANTGPNFLYPDDCFPLFEATADASAGNGGGRNEDGVTVYIQKKVGPYQAAVVASDDPDALVRWLRDNAFRVTETMRPYIKLYTAEKMKFLALRLDNDSDVEDIQPFKLTLPGTSPSIPLRITALAAEPEMGILVFVLGDRRYGPADWQDVAIDDSDIVWQPYSWPMETNWTALVARAVDEVEGKGFVTEMAGATQPLLELAQATTPNDPDQQKAQAALVDLLSGHAYLTRMYTRLSAEEMTSDPTFRRTGGGDVDRNRQLHRIVNGEDVCDYDLPERPPEPCDFASCGAGGLCRSVEDAAGATIAGCACIPGATARTTFDPQGRTIVACQDLRLSFLNVGQTGIDGADPLPDPCVDFDCGDRGHCEAVNMTPTCVCDEGLVAVGSLAEDGARQTRCVTPVRAVPQSFYQLRLPPRPPELPPGRIVSVAAPLTIDAMGGGGCAVNAADTNGAHGGIVALLLVAIGAAFRTRRGKQTKR